MTAGLLALLAGAALADPLRSRLVLAIAAAILLDVVGAGVPA